MCRLLIFDIKISYYLRYLRRYGDDDLCIFLYVKNVKVRYDLLLIMDLK